MAPSSHPHHLVHPSTRSDDGASPLRRRRPHPPHTSLHMWRRRRLTIVLSLHVRRLRRRRGLPSPSSHPHPPPPSTHRQDNDGASPRPSTHRQDNDGASPRPSTYDEDDGALVSPSPTLYVPPLTTMTAPRPRVALTHCTARASERECRHRHAIHVRMSASIAPYAYSPGEQHPCSPPYQCTWFHVHANLDANAHFIEVNSHTCTHSSRYYNNKFTFQNGCDHLKMVGRWSGDGPECRKCVLKASCDAQESRWTNKETSRK